MIEHNNKLHQPAIYWGEKRYHSLDYHFKTIFGEKVYRLSLNGGMTCPNRDGKLNTGGCIFCSAGGSGDFAATPTHSITKQIEEAKLRVAGKTKCTKYMAYFQAYTNTYAPIDYLRKIFSEAIEHPDIVALSIATRCDCLPPDVLDLLEELNHIKPVWVELGLQTIHEKSLKFIRSGFTLAQFNEAVTNLHAHGIAVIAHLILGLPGESKDDMLSSLTYVAKMPIAGLKLQLLHVLRDTELAAHYHANPFWTFSLEEYCDFIVDCIELLPPDIVLHRLTGDGPRKLLIAPLWSTDKKRVLNTITKRLTERDTWQGKYAASNILSN